MLGILDKAKEIFEKVKPLLMSEEKSDSGAKKFDPEIKPENKEKILTPVAEVPLEQPATEVKAGAFSIITAIINGAGVGLLLGALLGLSISPVVSGVIGTLSGLLAVLLGTSEKYMSQLKSVRIGAFGFFCVAGIMLGIHIRTNNAMLPDREKMMHDYTKVGFSKQEALDFTRPGSNTDLFELGHNLVLFHGAHLPEHFLPLGIEEDNRGDECHLVVLGQPLVLIDIDHQDLGFPGVFLAELL